MNRVAGGRWRGRFGIWDLGFGILLTLSPCLLVSLSLLLMVLLTACSAEESSGPQPPEIAYGFDTCASCGMLLSEPRFAAATLLENGETRKFDDVGEMVMYHMDHPNEMVEAWFQSRLRGRNCSVHQLRFKHAVRFPTNNQPVFAILVQNLAL